MLMSRRPPASLPLSEQARKDGPLRARANAHALSRAADFIGIDEAGRGCLAGPVVAAAVLFPAVFDFTARLPDLADSKKLNQKQRASLLAPIRREALACGVGLAWQGEIDRVNILNATFRAMSRAVLALVAELEEPHGPIPGLPRLRIDGDKVIPPAQWQVCLTGVPADALAWEQYLPLPLTRLPAHAPTLPEQESVVGGDALVPAISAASVLAKTARDSLMERLDAFYPGYGLARHKGYGTREHCELLALKGPCPLHRMSFRKVRPDSGSPAPRQASLFQG